MSRAAPDSPYHVTWHSRGAKRGTIWGNAFAFVGFLQSSDLSCAQL